MCVCGDIFVVVVFITIIIIIIDVIEVLKIVNRWLRYTENNNQAPTTITPPGRHFSFGLFIECHSVCMCINVMFMSSDENSLCWAIIIIIIEMRCWLVVLVIVFDDDDDNSIYQLKCQWRDDRNTEILPYIELNTYIYIYI